MFKQIIAFCISFIFFVNCSDTQNNQSNIPTNISKPFAVYNHAYQENFSADKINDIVATAHNAYILIDPFVDNITPYISTIHSSNNEIGGYISVGTGEKYRTDFQAMKPYLTSKAWPDWPDEFFVSQTTTGILPLMKARIAKMATWGLDWVEFDNMDWLDENTRAQYNLTVTLKEAKAYITALCDYTHAKGMKCMAKNTVDGFANFDGVTYESFHNEKNWWDKEGTKRFLAQNKPVIIVHYNETDCDGVYEEYKSFYNSDNISYICEDRNLKRYKHYNEE